MQELIDRIVAGVGIDAELAQKAVGIILGLLKQGGPEDSVSQLLNALPGAQELIGQVTGGAGEESGGIGGMLGDTFGGMMGGGGLMETVGQLNAAGIDNDQARSIGHEVLGFAREKAGADLVADITAAIPGLDALL